MFSNEPHCEYRNAPVEEVICQLRFPEILTIGANLPVEFQEAIRAEFPRYSARKEAPAPKISGTPGNMKLENQPLTINYQFTDADGLWKVNLTSKFISISSHDYHNWEYFAYKMDKPLAAFIQIYKPAYFERIGLRYLNFISREDLELEHIPYRELIDSKYLGILASDGVDEASASRSTVDAEFAIRGGCRAKIHAGPGHITRNGQRDSEVHFVFDQDLFMPGKIPVNHVTGALQILHAQAFSIFRGAITETLHNAMEPMTE